MRSSVVLLALCAMIVGPSLLATADDNYEPANPFTQPEPTNRRVSANISDDPATEEKPGFSLPRLAMPKLPKPSLPKLAMPKLQMPKMRLPQWTKPEPVRNPRPAGPSTWQKLSTGTKNMFTKTRDTLMPWTVEDPKPVARSATGSRRSTGMSRSRAGSNRGSSESSGEKKSFFGSLLPSSEPEEKPIRTTGDFLSQKRPQFD